jgi:hypothetical protein
MSLHRDEYAVYLPAVNDSYATETIKALDPSRPFPDGLTLHDLVFWEPNQLWHYPYLLHSVGLYRVGALPDNAVSQRDRASSTLVGDSGGYQIGKGKVKGLKSLRDGPMEASSAVLAWQQEFAAREWVVDWLETYTDYAMTIDMPLWATAPAGESSPFHNCSPQQLMDMTVKNLRFIEKAARGRTKWLNVVQGDQTATQIEPWWQAVKWFRHGGWAMAGSAGAKGGLANMLRALLMMRDDGAFEPGQDWVHVLGVSTPKWAALLSEVQRALRRLNPSLRVSFDSSSPFQEGGRYETLVQTPAFTVDPKTWSMWPEPSPQSRLHVATSPAVPFPYQQSPIGARLQLHHLSVRGGIWDHRQYDSISNMLITNHNVWVYLDAMKQANDLAAARDSARVPKLYLDGLDFIADVFGRDTWAAHLASNASLLDAVAPSEYA